MGRQKDEKDRREGNRIYTVNKPNLHLTEVLEGVKKQKVTEKRLNI